jgi:hypothetical protein
LERQKQGRRTISDEDHRQVHIKVGDMEADVDEGMAPLILELWRANMSTVMSCQGEPSDDRQAFIMFALIYDARAFLRLVGHDELLDHDPLQDHSAGGWGYAVNYFHRTYENVASPCIISFPPAELPAVLQRVRSNVGDVDLYKDDSETVVRIQAAYVSTAAKSDADVRKWRRKWLTVAESVLAALVRPAPPGAKKRVVHGIEWHRNNYGEWISADGLLRVDRDFLSSRKWNLAYRDTHDDEFESLCNDLDSDEPDRYGTMHIAMMEAGERRCHGLLMGRDAMDAANEAHGWRFEERVTRES